MLFHEHNKTNISEKYSSLYVLMSFRNISDFSELQHSVIYDERFRGSSRKLFADSHLLSYQIIVQLG
jgi:hypothetical protein